MLAQLDVRRESNIFPSPRCHSDDIGPLGKTMDRHAYVPQRQKHLQSYAQEQPPITPITGIVPSNNRGPQRHGASIGKKDSNGQLRVPPPYHRAASTCFPNYQLPPRLQKQYAAPMGEPNISLDYSPFPKQLGSTFGRRPHTIYSSGLEPQSSIVSSPLLTCPKTAGEPMPDIKAALSAQGIHIGIPPSTSHSQSPTDQVEPRLPIDQV
ncbi:hypothetical protein DEU56DRAFT_514050 [Suillus clintonianus]|uniref:uncharacterized protein n=1 Tax=Suillus clintonianus TaxID=1904413 RepID=UPI001B87A8CD|nr:uncharacterized protein DEU56DRAFT_514050 [Suillus clintonianus]KAG2152752.1 hypothetical protein DEU56DRAFT_514050 [Suillus clintonianus]